MDANLRNSLEKLAWLELYVPVQGSTKRLAEKLVRRGVKSTVAPSSVPANDASDIDTPIGDPPHIDPSTVQQEQDNSKMPENINHNKPEEATALRSDSFETKVAAYRATYERS